MHTYVFDIEHINQPSGERDITRVTVLAPPGDRILANREAWRIAHEVHGISLGSILHARLIADPSKEDA